MTEWLASRLFIKSSWGTQGYGYGGTCGMCTFLACLVSTCPSVVISIHHFITITVTSTQHHVALGLVN